MNKVTKENLIDVTRTTKNYIDDQFVTDTYVVNGCEAVDLGLKSSSGKHLLWATSNVGASSPSDIGLLFQFGRTDGYPYNSEVITNGTFGSGLVKTTSTPPTSSGSVYGAGTTLSLSDDAANVKMGGEWRMPTGAEVAALRELTSTWTTLDGRFGIRFSSGNNSIFIPAVGLFNGIDGSFGYLGTEGFVWSSTVGSDNAASANYLRFNSSGTSGLTISRYAGCSVRGVVEVSDAQLTKVRKEKYYTRDGADEKLGVKEDVVNKTTTIGPLSTNTQYPSAKAVWDELEKKVDKDIVGVAGGIATLDSEGHILQSQIPSSLNNVGLSVVDGCLCITYREGENITN